MFASKWSGQHDRSRPAVFIAPPFAAGRDIAGLVEMGAISKVPGTATCNVRSGPVSLR